MGSNTDLEICSLSWKKNYNSLTFLQKLCPEFILKHDRSRHGLLLYVTKCYYYKCSLKSIRFTKLFCAKEVVNLLNLFSTQILLKVYWSTLFNTLFESIFTFSPLKLSHIVRYAFPAGKINSFFLRYNRSFHDPTKYLLRPAKRFRPPCLEIMHQTHFRLKILNYTTRKKLIIYIYHYTSNNVRCFVLAQLISTNSNKGCF